MPVDMSGWNADKAEKAARVKRLVQKLDELPLKAAEKARDDAKRAVSHHRTWRHLAGSIAAKKLGRAKADVGYERRGQGKLGHIAEFGSARKAPHPAMVPASEKAEEWFYDESERLIGAIL